MIWLVYRSPITLTPHNHNNNNNNNNLDTAYPQNLMWFNVNWPYDTHTHTLDLDSMMQINKNSPLCCALLSANTNISLFFVPVLQFCTWPPFVYIFSICRRKCGLEALLSQTQCPQSGWCPQKMVVVYTKEKCTQNSSSHQLLQCSFWCFNL